VGAPSGRPALIEEAPAKVNLTLAIHGRRPDGYHELESLVAFARCGDRLSLLPGEPLGLSVSGPFAQAAGPTRDNLVLKGACALARQVSGLELGSFVLVKHLPVAAGVGGGSADAGAALRLLARANALDLADLRLAAAAKATGADVPICVDPRPRVMRGIGEKLSDPLPLPRLAAVLVNPGVPVATREVFGALAAPCLSIPDAPAPGRQAQIPSGREELLAFLRAHGNDLEAPAITVAPVIAEVLARLRATSGCELARMSGSGGTCFGLFASEIVAMAAARDISATNPPWWVCPTVLG
jgi:4-diphosphocytidyl-2-C-methyl-D-erythritol kinase